MPHPIVSCRLRLCLRVGAFAFIAVSASNCVDSARFSSENAEPYIVNRQPAPVQSVAAVRTRPAYHDVVTQPLPPSYPAASADHYYYSAGRAEGTKNVSRYRATTDNETAASHRAGREIYVVRPGETLGSIAARHGLSVAALERANKMKAHARVSAGDRILIPASARTQIAARQPQAETTKSVNSTQAAPLERSTGPALERPIRVASAQNIRIAKEEPKSTENTVKNTDPVGAIPSFRWPVHGRIINGFGSKSNGAQNDGINVAVPEGTPVRAAEDGVVASADNKLKSYGNLVLIRHANGYVSVYANNSELLVKQGDTVKRGQVIAHAGQTGNVNSPQLHFEIRKGSTPVDPNKYLGGA